MTAIPDWDKWRAEYDTTTFAAQQAEWDKVGTTYPDQTFWTPEPVLAALDRPGMTVTELGGWRGELACHTIPKADVSDWLNYDLCPWAIHHPECTHPAYDAILLAGWPWDEYLAGADVFVATHVIEHMRGHQLEQLAAQFAKFDRLVIEAPIVPDATAYTWDDSPTTHILELGWNQVEAIIATHGFTVTARLPSQIPAPDGTPTQTRIFTR